MRRWITFGLALVLAVLAGRWAKGLFTTAEYVHFSVNYPTEPGLETRPVSEVGGPWTMQEDFEAYPPGGVLVWGTEGVIEVDLGKRGMLKALLDPGKLLLSSHWIRNVGTEPRRIGLALEVCDLPVEWVTFEEDWDEARHESTRILDPGEGCNMDWIVHLPRERRERPVICAGGIEVRDAETGLRLTLFDLFFGECAPH